MGEGVRQAIEEYDIPREDIFVITKIYPSQFDDPKAAIDMALDKLDIGYIDMMLLPIRDQGISRRIKRWKNMWKREKSVHSVSPTGMWRN